MNIEGIFFVIVVFASMVLIHEFGHLLLAKATGVRVKEFAIGFGPLLWHTKYKGTRYSIRALPLGGFNNIDLDIDKKTKSSFAMHSLRDRLAILVAGSGFNLISAWIALFLLAFICGVPTPSSSIHSVVDGSPAYGILQKDDRILSANGLIYSDETRADVLDEIVASDNLELKILRDGEEITKTISKEKNSIIGISLAMENRPVSVFKAISESSYQYGRICNMFVEGLRRLLIVRDVEVTQAVSGPVGIGTMVYAFHEEAGISGVVVLFAILSINIGVMNLLPIPCLDGGHIVMQLFDAFLKKTFNKSITKQQIEYVSYAGAAVLAILMILGLYSDILRIMS